MRLPVTIWEIPCDGSLGRFGVDCSGNLPRLYVIREDAERVAREVVE